VVRAAALSWDGRVGRGVEATSLDENVSQTG